jgi:hypothetical protein
MDMERVFRKPKLLRALTTLDAGEFERLLAAFDAAWQAQRGERTHDGQTRQRKLGGGFKGTFKTSREKLFFVLFYFKCYPLQEVMGVLFGLSQGQVSHWVGVLTPLVNAALGRALLLPARRSVDLEKLLAEVPELRLLIMDGSERPIRRPKDKQRRKEDYSGKKKAHRKKNLLLSSHDRRVVYLGATSPGSVHDKKLADESGLSFPPDALTLKDTGFQGYEPPGTKMLQPKKKPRSRELYAWEKAINQIISKVRVGVEHAICGVKRCRIVADTFRCWRRGLVDEVVLAASGLHNLRVVTRQLA